MNTRRWQQQQFLMFSVLRTFEVQQKSQWLIWLGHEYERLTGPHSNRARRTMTLDVLKRSTRSDSTYMLMRTSSLCPCPYNRTIVALPRTNVEALRAERMALLTFLAKPLLASLLLSILYVLVRALHRLSPFHTLSHVPGPLLPRTTSLWLVYHAWIGDECTATHALHQRYGPIVRTGPSSVDIADGTALHDIYSARGGFRKPAFYGNFDIDGHRSIFSEVVPENRAPRAKAVLPLFATGSLRAGKERLDETVWGFVRRLEGEKERSMRMGKALNVLDVCRGLALDAVTGYLFGRAYGGLGGSGGEVKGEKDVPQSFAKSDEGSPTGMSANGMIDLFVGVGRFWYLPSWAFQWVDYFDSKFGAGSSEEVGDSISLVDKFVAGVVNDAQLALQSTRDTEDFSINGISTTSYPARLLAAGLSISETRAQCKDLIFAGTDSTGMNMATILFHLTRQPDVLAKLQHELEQNKDVTDLVEIQSLPYLRGVVREGLRLSMANPSRLPRVVPKDGWTFNNIYFPASTEVSCAPFELHLNPVVFPEPRSFKPERWMQGAGATMEMDRDAIPFGLGSRQCIARNLATAELFLATKAVAESGVLDGAKVLQDKVEILEWFNSHVIGGKIELLWS